jgi:dolichol kinase
VSAALTLTALIVSALYVHLLLAKSYAVFTALGVAARTSEESFVAEDNLVIP